MKKSIFFIAAVAVFAAISCEKAETPVEAPVDEIVNVEEIVFNITVGDPTTGTKAARTGWVSGDKLNIWFDGSVTDGIYVPDLVLTYDGSKWNAGSLRSGVQSALKSSGRLAAMFESNNDLSTYSTSYYSSAIWYTFPQVSDYAAGTYSDVCQMPYYIGIDYIEYTYSSNTITSNISGTWWCVSNFKVLLKNDNSLMNLDADKYTLQVIADPNGTPAYPLTAGAIVIRNDGNYCTLANGSANNFGLGLGIQEADGIAFYFKDFSVENKDILFNLWEDNDSSTKKSCTKTSKTVTCTTTSCTGVAINYSDFS